MRRAALSPWPARRYATISVSSHNSRWAWLPPILVSSEIAGSSRRTAPSSCRKRADAAAEVDGGAAGHQLAVGVARFELRQSCIERIAAGHRRRQCEVNVGKMRARLRKVFFAI